MCQNMVKFIVSLVILSTCCLYANAADQIVVAALQKIFKYATAANVKTLTTNCNKAASVAAAKKVVTAWVPKNWKAATAKLVASDPYSKQAYAKKKGLAFIDYRWALKTYITYVNAQAIKTKVLTAANAKKMSTMFWAADTSTGNNFTLTCTQFSTQAAKAFGASVVTSLTTMSETFAKANPKVYANLEFAY